MKFLLIMLASLSFSVIINAQDTTLVIINKAKVSEAIIKPGGNTALLLIKKSSLKNLKSIVLQVKGDHIGGELYKCSLEISGTNSANIDETKSRSGLFDISKTNIKKQLTSGKKVSLYLLMNPANPMMLMPSKRIFVGILAIK